MPKKNFQNCLNQKTRTYNHVIIFIDLGSEKNVKLYKKNSKNL
jgi:hypothetical protein